MAVSVNLDEARLAEVCIGIRKNFPYPGGYEQASVFKMVAYFVAHFMFRSPIQSFVNPGITGNVTLKGLNASLALDIARICLENSSIKKRGTLCPVTQPIRMSVHTRNEFVAMLADDDVRPVTHFSTLALLFEQMVYKTNPTLEYEDLYWGCPVDDEE